MKVLIVGLGSIAKKHIKALHGQGIKDIYALRSSRDSLPNENVIDIYSLKEIENHDFDFFLISNITSKHSEIIEQLLFFDRPLFIEKPVFGEVNSMNSALVKRISNLNVPTYVGCSLRFLDCLIEIKNLTKGSIINEVNVYSGSYLPDWRPNSDFRKSYSANKELGGGVHIDLIHELDYVYWIFGEPEATKSAFSAKSSLGIDAYDYAHYLWEYKSFNASVILNYYRRDSKRTLEVVTSERTYLVDLLHNKIFQDSKEIYSSQQRIIDTLDAQMEFFLNNVLTNKITSFNSIDEAYKILELCLQD
ncbi:Gfo/Idh/MocA family protein [Pontibacter locisalis]|uniref:Gfo/Idh/MocA family protein n=1 Tax=Pontibacter locisalis TaxID=1719035 RepID=A0ABW5IMT1_9BACT